MKWTDRVRQGMRRKGITQNDLAKELGLTQGAVSHYLAGNREPSIEQVREISRMLDVPLSELLGEDAVFINDDTQIKAAYYMKQIPEEKREAALLMLKSLTEE